MLFALLTMIGRLNAIQTALSRWRDPDNDRWKELKPSSASDLASRDIEVPETWPAYRRGLNTGPLLSLCSVLPARDYSVPTSMGILREESLRGSDNKDTRKQHNISMRHDVSEGKCAQPVALLFRRIMLLYIGI